MEGRHARQVVADYVATGQLKLAAGSEHYIITPRQQPRLRIHSDTCVISHGAPETDADCEDVEGSLGDARVSGDRLRVPPYAPLRLDSIDEIELIVDGKRAPARDAAGRKQRGWLTQLPDVELDLPADAMSWKPRERLTQLWGVQLGGSGFAQVSFRWAFSKYLHLELGAFFIGPEPVANGSAGLVAELPFENGWAPYIGAGGGGGLAAGPGEREECGKPIDECPYLHSHESTEFWYGRVGVAKYFSWASAHRFGLDVGFWRGVLREGEPDRSESFLWPMAGFSYHRGF